MSLTALKERKARIIFVAPWNSSFVSRDFAILSRHFDVRTIGFTLSRKDPRLTLRILVELVMGLIWADVCFCWFGGTEANIAVHIAKLLMRKTIVVVGGFEVAALPEIEYGAMRNAKSAKGVKYILDHVDKVVAVSEFSKGEILKHSNHEEKIALIYNGVECHDLGGMVKSDDIVITVAIVNEDSIRRKRLDCFVESARYLPGARFVIIGKWVDGAVSLLRSNAPDNVEFTGYLPESELLSWYRRAKVYCQLSLHESFGVALAEAMSFECVPVVSNTSALPEVVGDTGFILTSWDPEVVAGTVAVALKSDKGKQARQRVERMFTLADRERRLVQVINNLVR